MSNFNPLLVSLPLPINKQIERRSPFQLPLVKSPEAKQFVSRIPKLNRTVSHNQFVDAGNELEQQMGLLSVNNGIQGKDRKSKNPLTTLN